MIQFNLLPNVKLEYVKARRFKRMTFLISSIVAGVALLIFIVLLVGVQIIQKNYSKNLTNEIKKESSALQGTTDLNKILTIQNQLDSLPQLHEQKPVATRLLDFIKQVTPSKVSAASMTVNFDTQAISITGSADSISTINKFIDTLKFTTYKTEDNKENKAFSAVVLSSFGRDNKGASYQASFKFDPVIFSGSSKVTLIVPAGKITTRSETEKPESLFQPLSKPEEEGQ